MIRVSHCWPIGWGADPSLIDSFQYGRYWPFCKETSAANEDFGLCLDAVLAEGELAEGFGPPVQLACLHHRLGLAMSVGYDKGYDLILLYNSGMCQHRMLFGKSKVMLRHFPAVIVIAFWASQGFADDDIVGPESLAAVVKPFVPVGWAIAVKGSQVVLSRGKPIEIYNGIALPGPEAAKERLQIEKLVISLRLQKHMDQNEYQVAVRENEEAVRKAREDTGNGKLFPDSAFWREHRQYNYREIPSFDLGDQSILMTCQPEFVVFVGRRRGANYGWRFWDEKVESECQGIIDDIGKLFRTYAHVNTPSPQIKASDRKN